MKECSIVASDFFALPARLQGLLMPVPWSGCWLFTGIWDTNNGYGKLQWNSKHTVIHRVTWELLKGPICPTFVLDHKCRVRCCANPDHLDPVTNGINTARGNAMLYKPREAYL